MFTAGQHVVLVRAAGRDYARETVAGVLEGVATVAGMQFDAATGRHQRAPMSVWIEAEGAANLAACDAQAAAQSASESMSTLEQATPAQLAGIAAELAAAVAALPT